MLSLKKQLALPKFGFRSRTLALSPVVDDADELIQAIDQQQITNDDTWQLDAMPDTVALEKSWNEIAHDISQDPDWFRFSDDE